MSETSPASVAASVADSWNTHGGSGLKHILCERSLRPAGLLPDLSPGTVVAGDGAAAVLEAAREAGLDIRERECEPLLAAPVALWGCRTLRAGESYRPGTLRPSYVRPSDAEAARP